MATLEELGAPFLQGLQVGSQIGHNIAQNRLEQQRLDRLTQQAQIANAIQEREQRIKEAQAARAAELFQQEQDFAARVRSTPMPGGGDFEAMPQNDQEDILQRRMQAILEQAPPHMLPTILPALERNRTAIAEKRYQDAQDRGFGEELSKNLSGVEPTRQAVLQAFSGAAAKYPGAKAVKSFDVDAAMRAISDPMLGLGAKARLVGLQQKTGINFLDPVTFEIVDQAAYERANVKSGEMEQTKLKPATLRTAQALVSDFEDVSGQKLDDKERKRLESVYATSGNRPPTLSDQEKSQIRVAEYATDATARLMDEIKAHPEVTFGPGLFRFDKAKGEWISETSAASKIAQLYTTLYAGKAFYQGGKNLTELEAKLTREQIGDPTQSNFAEKLATAQTQYHDELGRTVRDLQDKQFDKFPVWSGYVNRLAKQYADDEEKYGLKASGAYAVPAGATPGASKYKIIEVK